MLTELALFVIVLVLADCLYDAVYYDEGMLKIVVIAATAAGCLGILSLLEHA
jgi:hypothetical protein